MGLPWMEPVDNDEHRDMEKIRDVMKIPNKLSAGRQLAMATRILKASDDLKNYLDRHQQPPSSLVYRDWYDAMVGKPAECYDEETGVPKERDLAVGAERGGAGSFVRNSKLMWRMMTARPKKRRERHR